MTCTGDLAELPNVFFENVVSEVIRDENIQNVKTVVSLASSKGENYLGLLFRIDVTGQKDDKESNLKLVLKIPLQSEMMREKFPLGKIYTREVFAYNDMLPQLCTFQDKFNIPESEKFKYVKCYRASSEGCKEYIIMDNMIAQGFRMAQRRYPLGFNHLKLLLQTLARFHALSFVMKKIEPDRFQELSRRADGASDFLDNDQFTYFFDLARDRAIGVLKDQIHMDKVKEYGIDLIKKLKYYVTPETVDNYAVLCHGDCWTNNVLFKFEDDEPVDLRILDWQMVRHSSPITDIAYLIFNSTDEELRKEHLTRLMDHYHECLGKTLRHMGHDIEDCYPKSVFDDHLRKILPYGLLMSFLLLPAVLGEVEDVPDMDALLLKDKVEASDLKFENKQASDRFESRMRGVVQTFVDMKLI